MASEEHAMDIIKGMSGTLEVFPLDMETREGVLSIEREIKSQMGLPVKNEGIEECMKRQFVLGILKNKDFRPPPEPTVILMADEGTIIGIEVLPGQKSKYEGQDNIMWLCEDFIIYLDRQPKVREFFYMPPVSFPELDNMNGYGKVVSCSPSPLSDILIKNKQNLEDDPKNATILVGFDVVKH